MSGRLKPAHDFLSYSGRLMRILRTVVESFIPVVLDTGHDLGLRRAVTLELICNDHARDILQALQQLAEELLRRLLISPALDEDVQHLTLLIHCSPKVMCASVDTDEHLVEVPPVTGPGLRRRKPLA